MIAFPHWFFEAVIYGGIVLAIAGAVMLLIFWFMDMKRKSLW